ncbi:type II secretion system F family protein [Nocardioides sp.]|uniref:type II secretion system F family protein n=1 Tax=Nocardioides sp. TaxID=35761 RepID=UPI0035170CC7
MLELLAAAGAALAIALALPPCRSPAPTRAEPVGGGDAEPAPSGDRPGPLRTALTGLGAGAGIALFLGGGVGLLAGGVGGVLAGRWVRRQEPESVRRECALVRRDLPVLVALLSAALRSGLDAGAAASLVAHALPGPAAARLRPVVDRLRLGVPPEEVWRSLAADPELAPLGRALARAARSGAGVAEVVARLADDLAAQERARAESEARRVGVRAAVPLGLCLLPAFLVLGVVPVVAATLRTLV